MSKEYLHAYHESSLGELEAQRLHLFNLAYAPKTHQILDHIITTLDSPLNILELGVGTGAIGSWLSKKVAHQGKYVGIDKDPQQLEKAAKVISGPHTALLKINLLDPTHIEKLLAEKPTNGYHLIYCRWVLCHIQKKQRIALIRQIMDLLANNGVFVCEEPNYHSMHLLVNGTPVEDPAISEWKEMVKSLQQNVALGLDLEMDAHKLLTEFSEAISNNQHYDANIADESTPTLVGEQKYALVLGLQTAKDAILSTGKSTEEFLALLQQFEEIAENLHKAVVYYTNTYIKLLKN